MSLGLDLGTRPEGVRAILLPDGHVDINGVEISPDDFCQLALWFLTTSDLRRNDPRFHFMQQLAKLNPIAGFNPGGVRFG